MSKLDEFLAGDRHEDVALFLTDEYLDSDGKLRRLGEEVEDGYVLVVDGDDGRSAFSAGTGMDAMEFSRTAMERDGHVHRDLGGGECPEAGEEGEGDDGEDHRTEFIFAFSEAENEEVGGLYARGEVIHAYAHCACGANYSDKWVVDEEEETGVQPGGTEPVHADE
ncbi:DUF5807 family protein [Halogeometricum sp. S1BR25-6]|uniref:DUF5807 family protein n=1 Tax=Halogeometricum salsisoli TaxID=2950536 RepID=A0ABU2GID2_9EURY|nr:DUF5807 family protein [Halogeometricum sp. S1BR25-6]MDS0300028.1 DUF5807 family protein [Halogeometricum sp. S1BR25-6]